MKNIGFYILCLLTTICCPYVYPQSITISEEMKNQLKAMEGLSLEVYMDGFYRAVGYGHRITKRDPEWIYELVQYDEITSETAEILFELDMIHIVSPGLQAVIREIGVDYPPNVYDVMGSLIYNIGLAGLRETEFYCLFKNKEYEKSFRALLATKSEKDGLLNRRFKELKILTLNYDFKEGCYMGKSIQDDSAQPYHPLHPAQ